MKCVVHDWVYGTTLRLRIFQINSRTGGGRGSAPSEVSDFRGFVSIFAFVMVSMQIFETYVIYKYILLRGIRRIFCPYPAAEPRFKWEKRWFRYFWNSKVRDLWAFNAWNSTSNNSIDIRFQEGKHLEFFSEFLVYTALLKSRLK